MSLIESYHLIEEGYHPVLVRDSWQVAKLNYSVEYHIDHFKKLVIHQKSDKALSLLEGSAMLIVGFDIDRSEVEIVQMKRGTSYNIPKNTAYAIVLEEGSQLFIVEQPNTYLDDVLECDLSQVQIKEIRQKINSKDE